MAGGSGFLTATALGVGQQAPTQTTTVDVGTGVRGPTGPAGPAGGGAEQCPAGSSFQAVRINGVGGHVTIWTCVAG